MKIFFLFLAIFFTQDITAQYSSFINQEKRVKKRRLVFGSAGNFVLQDFSISLGGSAVYHLMEKKHYSLTVHGEVYPSLMYFGHVFGCLGKVGVHNHFRFNRKSAFVFGIGKNLRTTIYSLSNNKRIIRPLHSNFQIDIGFSEYGRGKKRYYPISSVYLSYSNIGKSHKVHLSKHKHIFELTAYYSLNY